MIVQIRPSVAKSSHYVCGFHQKRPGEPYAGCTCSSAYWLEEKPRKDWTDEEVRRMEPPC